MSRKLKSSRKALSFKRRQILPVLTQLFRTRIVITTIALIGIGLLTLLLSSAATPFASTEPEAAACGPLQKFNSNSSGGGHVRFTQGGCASVAGADFYPQSDCSSLPAGQYCFQRMGLGAGGWMSSVDVGIDDTVAMRTDATVPVVLEKDGAGKPFWMPILSKSSLPASITSDPNWAPKEVQTGASEIAVYDKNLLYYRAIDGNNGLIWKADKSSGSWKLSRITSSNPTLESKLYMDPNEQPGGDAARSNVRFRSKYMVISKTNPRIVYVTAFDGIWRTGDAGANWSKVYSWDENQCRQLYNGCSSLIINDAEGKVYAFVKNAQGVMTDRRTILEGSISGGGLGQILERVFDDQTQQYVYKPVQIADSVRNIVYDRVGTVYYTLENDTVWKMKNNVRTQINVPNSELSVGIAAHKDGQRIAVSSGGHTGYALSNDQGNTWSTVQCCAASGATLRSSDVGWMLSPNRIISDWGAGEADTSTLSTIAYAGDRLWLADGIGAYYRDPATPAKDWIGLSRGIENMINQSIRSFKDTMGKNRIIWGMQDRHAMMQKWSNNISEVGQAAAQTYTPLYNLYNALRHGQGIGTSPNGKYVVTSYYGANPRITCSSDSGTTVRVSDVLDSPWKAIGAWAINDSGQALFVPYSQKPDLNDGMNGSFGKVDCNAAKPVMTVVKLPSSIQYRYQDSGGSAVPGSYTAAKLLADIDDNNTFYMVTHWGTGSGYNAELNAFNVYSSSDLNNWTKVGTAGPMNDAIFGGKMKTVPGKPGVVFVTNGDSGGAGSVCDQPAYVRAPGSSTFTAMPGVSEVLDFGFGLPASGGAFPQAYFTGCYNGRYGIWTSTDFNPTTASGTWTQIDNDSLWRNPTASAGPITGIDGDKVRVGCFYMITRDHGAYYACKKS